MCLLMFFKCVCISIEKANKDLIGLCKFQLIALYISNVRSEKTEI